MDKIQSGPLMVKSLTGRCSWINLSKWSPYGEIPQRKTLCKVQMVKWLSHPRCVIQNSSLFEGSCNEYQ
jgi:hypothetical protein